MWLICYYNEDLYSPSIHQPWLPHLIILRPRKQQGVWTIQRFSLFLNYLYKCYILFKLYYTVDMSADMLTDMVDVLTNVNQYWPRFGQHIDWQWEHILTRGCLQYKRYKKFMIKCIVCLLSTLIYLYGHICIHLIEV